MTEKTLAIIKPDAVKKNVIGRIIQRTIRHAFGFSIERNATHGSDARDTAEWELGYFFKK